MWCGRLLKTPKSRTRLSRLGLDRDVVPGSLRTSKAGLSTTGTRVPCDTSLSTTGIREPYDAFPKALTYREYNPKPLSRLVLHFLEQCNIPVKQDFYKQIPLQAKAYDAFIGRDDAIAFAIENLTRVNTFVAGQDKVQSNNLRFPLVGAKGGPGVGKTAFIDALAEKLTSASAKRLVVSVSCKDVMMPKVPLAVRILFRAFSASSDPSDWVKFASIECLHNVSIYDACNAILGGLKLKYLHVCVDELSEDPHGTSTVDSMRLAMYGSRKKKDHDMTTRVSFFITSLNGHEINFSLPEVTSQILTQEEWKTNPLFRLLLHISGGHPGFLSALYRAFPHIVGKDDLDFDGAFLFVLPYLDNNMRPNLIDLAYGILNREINSDSDGDSDDYLIDGLYYPDLPNNCITDPDTDDEFVPIIPLFFLYQWTREEEKNVPFKLLNYLLKEFIALHMAYSSQPSLNKHFSRFHAYHQALVSRLEGVRSASYILSPVEPRRELNVCELASLVVRDEISGTQMTLSNFLKDVRQKESMASLDVEGVLPGVNVLEIVNKGGLTVTSQHFHFKRKSNPQLTDKDCAVVKDAVEKFWGTSVNTLIKVSLFEGFRLSLNILTNEDGLSLSDSRSYSIVSGYNYLEDLYGPTFAPCIHSLE